MVGSRKFVLSTLTALALGMVVAALPASAQTPVLSGATFPCPGSTSQCFRPPVAGVPLGFQQLTSLGSAASLTVPSGATEALVVCTGQTITWRDDGTAPTATIGMPLTTNTPFAYTGKLTAIQLIQTAATATCNVSYYR